MDKSKERYAGFASLRDLKNAYLLLARGMERRAADEDITAKKAGAGAEKSSRTATPAYEKGEELMQEELEGETTPPALEGGEQIPEEEKPQDKPQEKPVEEENLPQGEIISRRVRRFLAEYPAARLLKEGILAEIQADPAIEASPYCLEIALGRAAGKAYRSAGQYAADEEFIRDYILTDKNIKGRIIEEYLSAVAGGKPPAIMASSGKMTASAPEKPASVSAAGRILERMLKERRI